MKSPILLLILALTISIQSCGQNEPKANSDTGKATFEFQKTDEKWREDLTPMAYKVLRQKGTEPAFSGEYESNKKNGIYLCAGCQNPLFNSNTKFDSGTGWPSFYTFVGDSNVVELPDNSHGWNRVEVLCGRCGGHLGHVFEDGPKPTGLRYCVNSASLLFEEEK